MDAVWIEKQNFDSLTWAKAEFDASFRGTHRIPILVTMNRVSLTPRPK
jgi:hypothetical protein